MKEFCVLIVKKMNRKRKMGCILGSKANNKCQDFLDSLEENPMLMYSYVPFRNLR